MQRSREEQDLSFNKSPEPVENGHDLAASPVNPWYAPLVLPRAGNIHGHGENRTYDLWNATGSIL